MNVFQILVTAIVAAILIFIVYNLWPNLFPSQNIDELLSNNLDGAQLVQGKPLFSEILVQSGKILNASNFDSSLRSVAFECNDEQNCCNENEKCGRIEWDKRLIKFNSNRKIETATRCAFQENIFACKIFFGKAPAQISLKKTGIKPEINLEEEDALLKLKIENSGAQTMPLGEIKIDIFEEYFSNGIWRIKAYPSISKKQALKQLLPGESKEVQIPIDVFEGSFELKIIVSGENSGFDENKVKFKATGTSGCTAKKCDYPTIDAQTGECKTTCYCEGCQFGCEEKIKKATPKDLGLRENTGLVNAVATTSGSNTVEFVLDSKECN